MPEEKKPVSEKITRGIEDLEGGQSEVKRLLQEISGKVSEQPTALTLTSTENKPEEKPSFATTQIPTSRQWYKGKFVGFVQDAITSQSLDAKVTAISRTANWTRETRTDNKGYYEIDVPPGIYSISAKADGYERHTKYGVEASEFREVGLHFTLKPSRPRKQPPAQTTRPPTPPPPAEQPSRPPPSIKLTISPEKIKLGETSALVWVTENADYVVIRDDEGRESRYDAIGGIGVSPQKTTTYLARAYGNGIAFAHGDVIVEIPPTPSQQPPVNVTVNVPPTIPAPPEGKPSKEGIPGKPEIKIIAEPREVTIGKPTTLIWESKNANRVNIGSRPPYAALGKVRLSGITRTVPITEETTTFIAVAVGPGGVANAEVTVHSKKMTGKEKVAEKYKKKREEREEKEEEKTEKEAIEEEETKKWYFLWMTKKGFFTALIIWFILSFAYELLIGWVLGIVGLKASGFFRFIGPIVIGILVFVGARGAGKGKGGLKGILDIIWKIGKPLLPFIGIFILIYFIFGFRSFANLTDMEWYLSRLDLLKSVGVPSATVDNVKAGIRNALSFLFKEKEVIEKPVAEKIGSWQALDVKFGSKYTEPPFSPRKVYANDSYYLPVTISNPNTIESGIKIEDLYITSNDCQSEDCTKNLPEGEAAMKTSEGFKLMCGFAPDTCTKAKKCSIDPQMEKEILINFEDYLKVNKNCITLKDISHTEEAWDVNVKDGINSEDCQIICTTRNKMTYFTGSYNSESKMCTCQVKKRSYNNVTELCLNKFNDTIEIGSEAKPEFRTYFSFNVEGNSEFRIFQKESDVKLLSKPKITTSTGPLGITVYFVPGYYSLDKPTTSIKMFVSIVNKGGGSAKIKPNEISITIPGSPQVRFTEDNIRACMEEINQRASTVIGLFINQGDEKEIPCSMSLTQPTTITGTYITIPINVKMNYTYSQYYSQNIPIQKTFVDPKKPDEATYIGLPGYCPRGFRIP